MGSAFHMLGFVTVGEYLLPIQPFGAMRLLTFNLCGLVVWCGAQDVECFSILLGRHLWKLLSFCRWLPRAWFSLYRIIVKLNIFDIIWQKKKTKIKKNLSVIYEGRVALSGVCMAYSASYICLIIYNLRTERLLNFSLTLFHSEWP